MKSILALVLGVILISFTADVLAEEINYFARDDEALYGTWVNLDYTSDPHQKLVYNPDGTAWIADNADSKLPDYRIRYLITGRRKDSQGNIMYKTRWVGNWGDDGYSLCRISNSGNTLEIMTAHAERPKEFDPKSSKYRKYTRK